MIHAHLEANRETASRPVNITNPNGFILLRAGEIETPVLVAHDFDLRKGRVEVTVPDVMTRNDFSLVCELSLLSMDVNEY